MVVYSALIPYLPLSPRSDDLELKNAFKKTTKALEQVKEELYVTSPETVIIIGSHEEMGENFFNIFISDEMKTSYAEIGDFETHRSLNIDIHLAQKIKEASHHRLPVMNTHSTLLSYPMSFATDQLIPIGKKMKICPITYSWADNDEHIKFGAVLRDLCEEHEGRIAIIAVGNLSQSLTPKSPAKYSPLGKKYDDQIKKILKSNLLMEVAKIKPEVETGSSNSSYKQLLILAGFMQEMQINPKILCYEHPFGVGYLTATLWR